MKDWKYFWHVSAIFCAMWDDEDATIKSANTLLLLFCLICLVFFICKIFPQKNGSKVSQWSVSVEHPLTHSIISSIRALFTSPSLSHQHQDHSDHSIIFEIKNIINTKSAIGSRVRIKSRDRIDRVWEPPRVIFHWGCGQEKLERIRRELLLNLVTRCISFRIYIVHRYNEGLERCRSRRAKAWNLAKLSGSIRRLDQNVGNMSGRVNSEMDVWRTER